MKRVTALIGVLIVAGSASCRKTGEHPVVGRWEPLEADRKTNFVEDRTLDFHEDGTVTVVEEREAVSLGQYELAGENTVNISNPEFGTMSGAISASGDEMSLTTLSGQVDRYGKVERIREVTGPAVAGNYSMVTHTAGEDFINPGIVHWEQDGAARVYLCGQWQALDQLDLLPRQSSVRISVGEIRADTLFQEPPGTSLTKQEGAEAIAELAGGGVLWSGYQGSSDASGNTRITLNITKDGTFEQITSIKDAWRIRDGKVEIPVWRENQEVTRVAGEIDGYTIVFPTDEETELRFVRRSRQIVSVLQAPRTTSPETKTD